MKKWQDFDSSNYGLIGPADLIGADTGYWLYHLGRWASFAAQGLTSVVVANAVQALGAQPGAEQPAVTPRFLQGLSHDPALYIRRTLSVAVETFRQDLGYIKAGNFKEPYDMSPRHRQWSPVFVSDSSLRYLREAVAVLQRSAERADTKTWLDSGDDLYPDYFRHTFHYQTDGWLSSDSAKVYETSTETLFMGRQDAMQRTTLVHIADHFRANFAAPDGRGTKLLEIGCGTGRVMTFIRDNWPAMDVTASDLSPFYLEEARKNNAYWERNFAPAGGVGPAAYVKANAEALPFEAGSFDIVVSVYLFHELPAVAQDRTFAEAARVLAPGGVFVLTDSLQLGDQPALDPEIGRFGNFAEPHYEAYIRRDLAALARVHGLEPRAKELSSATKSLSFTKPSESA